MSDIIAKLDQVTAAQAASQPLNTNLTALGGLTSAASKGIQFTGSGTAAVYDLTTAGKALLDDAAASDQRTTLGLGTLATQSGTFSGTSSGTNTGDQTLPTRASLVLDTTDSPQFAGLNVGAATDTTITRTGAGDIAVEGNGLYRAGGTDVPVADGGTGASTAAGARTNLGVDVVWPLIPVDLSGAINFNRTFMQMTSSVGAATRLYVTLAAGPGNSGTITSGDDTDGPWQLLTSAATINNEATMYSVTIFRRDWGAMAFGTFKTPAAFAVGVWEAGFTSGALGTAAVPATSCALFRYSTAADNTAFWRTVTNDAGTGTVTATTVAVAVSTVYRWAIRLLASSIEYYMATGDGAMTLVDTCTTTLPATTTAMALLTRVLTLENVAKAIQWGRYTIVMKS